MIKTANNFAIVPCIILSLILHGAVFFIIVYKNAKEPDFIQIPFDVSFYSPQASAGKIKSREVPKEQKKTKSDIEAAVKKEEVTEKEIKKDDIVIGKKKEKPEKKNKKQKDKQEIKEEQENKTDTVREESTEEVKKEKEDTENRQAQEQKDTQDTNDVKDIRQKAETTAVPQETEGYSKGIMLENKNFKYSYYTGAILKKIKRYWQDSNINILRTVVYFKIEKNGQISKLKISKSSKDEVFDKNALRAVELASPFPPLPDGYEENSLGVYFEFKTS